jgi:hypothetical protein
LENLRVDSIVAGANSHAVHSSHTPDMVDMSCTVHINTSLNSRIKLFYRPI